jgi:hypothetical protein
MNFNYLPRKIAAWQHWIAVDTILNVLPHGILTQLSDPTISFPAEMTSRILETRDKATSTIQTYIHDIFNNVPKSNPLVSTITSIYTSHATNPIVSAELCGICGSSIPATSLEFSHCPSGHSFRTHPGLY